MKNLFTLLALAFISTSSFGQTINNPGMETWRINTAGTGPVIPIAAPHHWYGFDSLVIAAGEAFGAFIGAGDDWKRQIFEENTFVHSGSAAALCVTVKQDTLGFFPGTLSNAQPVFNAGVVAGGGDPADAIAFDGGTPTTLRITSASAWVAYLPGKDPSTGAFGGADVANMNVQAIATIAGEDSVVGVGSVNITPTTSYVQVTATVNYTTTAYNVHTVRIIFASGGASGTPLDSSMLYVDDVSMVGEPQTVNNLTYKNNIVRVYPTPTNGIIYINGPANGGYTFTVSNVVGQVVATQQLNGTDEIDLNKQPAGVYAYTVTDRHGEVVQTGKVQIER